VEALHIDRPQRIFRSVGVLCEYFAAPDDATAAGCLESGPAPPLAVVSANGIDPVVILGQLETLSGGRSLDEQSEDPEAGRLVAQNDAGEAFVLGLSPVTGAAIAGIDDADVPRIAAAWVDVEEFGGTADPEGLAGVLRQLRGLARDASETGDRLYCWWSL
jgi:hypothetical protein